MNAFTQILKKIGAVIEWPFKHAAQLIKTIEDGLKDEPAVKTAIVGLIRQIETVTADAAAATVAKGLDIPEDIQTVQAAETLFRYVTSTFLPAIETAYTDLKADVGSMSADTAPEVSAAPALAAN